MSTELPQEIRNAILCEWSRTAADLVFRALGKKSKCTILLSNSLLFDFYDVIDCVLEIYKRQRFPRLARLRPKARAAFFELSAFVEGLDSRDSQYFLDALDNFQSKDLVF